ncbi:MAG TPA: sodium-dependent phosphate transporter [Clostridiales bacterium]|nr:sodium-dependent phosphate transporter [Clostridiales bacterium]
MGAQEILQLIQSLIWLLAGVGVFIVGMNFMGDALEKCTGNGMKKLLEKISNNRFSGVGIGAGVTAIIQSSSATSVMVIGLVNAGVMTLMQATPIIMGANIGTTVTGVLVSLKSDYFNMVMYVLAFVGVLMGFTKKEKVKIAGSLCCGLGLIFVGLNVMSSEQAFGNPLVKDLFKHIFSVIDFPLLLIVVGMIFTALIQSSSAATGVVITMVGNNVLPLDLALFIVLGANIGTCVTALLASIGANANSKRVALIHFTFNVIGTAFFTIIIWIFRQPVVNMLSAMVPGNNAMALQMRISIFHVIFNVSTTCLLLPFVKQLVSFSRVVIKDKTEKKEEFALKYVDDRLLSMTPVALMQVKKEIEYMMSLVEKNIGLAFIAEETKSTDDGEQIHKNEELIDFTNTALTDFLIKLSVDTEQSDETVIGSYFHVLNDLERIGDYAENFFGFVEDMRKKGLSFSEQAQEKIREMYDKVREMFTISRDAFETGDKTRLTKLSELENEVDGLKRKLTAEHFTRLAEGQCSVECSPYYSSLISGLERIGDHLVNVGYSITNPTGSQKEAI